MWKMHCTEFLSGSVIVFLRQGAAHSHQQEANGEDACLQHVPTPDRDTVSVEFTGRVEKRRADLPAPQDAISSTACRASVPASPAAR